MGMIVILGMNVAMIIGKPYRGEKREGDWYAIGMRGLRIRHFISL
jgi:hypothetical protein